MKVALVDSVSSSVQAILHDTSPCNPNPRVAIFYSITSTQQGLSGIDLGSFLIKRVVRELTQTVPGLHTFCTLSPIPGFRTWLESQIDNQQSTILLFENEIESIKSLLLSSGLTANGDERVLLTVRYYTV
jgi:malonyl-CoA decarboxylase